MGDTKKRTIKFSAEMYEALRRAAFDDRSTIAAGIASGLDAYRPRHAKLGEDGQAKSVPFPLTLSIFRYERLAGLAKGEGRTMADVLRDCAALYLSRRKGE